MGERVITSDGRGYDRERKHEADVRYREQNREKIRARHKAWRDANPEKVKAYAQKAQKKHRERNNAKSSAWRNKNFEHNRLMGAKRRGLLGTAGADDRGFATVLRGDPCAYCGSPSSTIDHITPGRDGGSVGWENMTAACRSCNSRKRNQPLLAALLTLNVSLEPRE